MFLFGHVGITLGAAVLASGAYNLLDVRRREKEKNSTTPSNKGTHGILVSQRRQNPYSPVNWVKSLGRTLDIRLLLIGAILPDLIDKPLGNLFFRDFFSNGRIFSHTMFFVFVVMAAGLVLYYTTRRKWLLTLGVGCFGHLILDQMWLTPETLLWPAWGWSFPKYLEPNIISAWIRGLKTAPSIYIPEIIGFVILLAFTGLLLVRRRAEMFLKRGWV